jgi:hypothetical protein
MEGMMKRLTDKWNRAVNALLILAAFAYMAMTAYCMVSHRTTLYAWFVVGSLAGAALLGIAEHMSITAYKARKYDEIRRKYHD